MKPNIDYGLWMMLCQSVKTVKHLKNISFNNFLILSKLRCLSAC